MLASGEGLATIARARRYNDELELEDAVHTALLTLKEVRRAAPRRPARRHQCPPRPHRNRAHGATRGDAWLTARASRPQGFEGAMDHNNIEVGFIGSGGSFKVLTPAEIKDYLGEVM